MGAYMLLPRICQGPNYWYPPPGGWGSESWERTLGRTAIHLPWLRACPARGSELRQGRRHGSRERALRATAIHLRWARACTARGSEPVRNCAGGSPIGGAEGVAIGRVSPASDSYPATVSVSVSRQRERALRVPAEKESSPPAVGASMSCQGE